AEQSRPLAPGARCQERENRGRKVRQSLTFDGGAMRRPHESDQKTSRMRSFAEPVEVGGEIARAREPRLARDERHRRVDRARFPDEEGGGARESIGWELDRRGRTARLAPVAAQR